VTYYADLTVCDYFSEVPGALVAIGWLDGVHPFTKGASDSAFMSALIQLAIDPWQPAVSPGVHFCELCAPGTARMSVNAMGQKISIGRRNIFVPYRERVFVAPTSIVHYVLDHKYTPPAIFQRAVLECSPMRSSIYMENLRARDVRFCPPPRTKEDTTEGET